MAPCHRWQLDYTDDTTYTSPSSQPQRSAAVRSTIDQNAVPPAFPPNISARSSGALRAAFSGLPNTSASSTPAPGHPVSLSNAYSATWSIAFSPARNLVTTVFALFMTGSTVQFFSVMTCVTVLFMQLQPLLAVTTVFAPVLQKDPRLRGRIIPQVLVYCLMCSVGLAAALYKCHILGFLPTTRSDWVRMLPMHHVPEYPHIVGGLDLFSVWHD